MSKFLIPVFVAAFGVSSLAFVTTASGESTTPIVVPPSPSG